MSFRKRTVIAAIILVVITIVTIAFIPALPKVTDNVRDNFGTLENESGNKPSLGMAAVAAVTPYVTEYSLPNGTLPNAILVDRSGMVWTVGSGTFIELDPKNGELRSYQIPGEVGHSERMSWSIVEDRDNSIWFSQFGAVSLWRFDTLTERFESFHTDNAPYQMKVDDRDGDIWFTTLTGNTLGVVQKVDNTTDTESYQIREFPTGNDTYPSGLALSGDSVLVSEL